MRIDVVTVITGLDEAALERRRQALMRFASPGTDIRLVVTGSGPASVESEAELELAAPGILKAVLESAESGADGIVIWGGHDPSLRSARELVDVPVIGPGMASMLLACSLARRFSLLVQLPNVLAIAERQIRELGLGERCASIRSVDVPVLELAGDEVFPKMLDAALAAVDEDGADAICLGCMAMTPHAPRLARELDEQRPGALVIDPGLAAVRWLEMTIGMGLSHSRRSYLNPPKPVTF
ncbi:MAG TPA: aspartate/glutamate racemase family protein [Thermomicrobiales bacterium]|nr:aspartate/glutamate racemase family protein [Thermomicrobiales bacterium]